MCNGGASSLQLRTALFAGPVVNVGGHGGRSRCGDSADNQQCASGALPGQLTTATDGTIDSQRTQTRDPHRHGRVAPGRRGGRAGVERPPLGKSIFRAVSTVPAGMVFPPAFDQPRTGTAKTSIPSIEGRLA